MEQFYRFVYIATSGHSFRRSYLRVWKEVIGKGKTHNANEYISINSVFLHNLFSG